MIYFAIGIPIVILLTVAVGLWAAKKLESVLLGKMVAALAFLLFMSLLLFINTLI